MKIYKKFFILLISCFSTNIMLSQVIVTLTVDPNPSPQLSEWVDKPGLAIFTVTNTDPDLEGADYRIKVEMYLNNKLVLNTNNNVSVQRLELGTQTFFAEDIIPSSALEFPTTLSSGSFQDNIIQTGMLPAGIYEFCVSIVSVNGEFITIPLEVCNAMLITDYQMPELINPAHNLEISSILLPSTIFTWSPMSPPPPKGLKYIIAVSEVYDGQSPSQAFLVNYPIIEEEIIVGTQFIWPVDIVPPSDTTQYAWSVKAVNFDDVAYKTTTNGFVPPETFTVIPIVTPKSGEDTSSTDSTADICECFEFRYFKLPVTMILGSENPSSFLNSSSNGNIFSPPNASIPELTIVQPEPIVYPRKVKLDGVIDIRDYLFDCISPSDEPKTIATATIKWDDTHSEPLANNGPFEHEYSAEDAAPDSIFVTYKIENKPSYPTFLCEKDVCIAVPQAVLDLNNVDTSGVITVGSIFQVGEQGEFSVIVDSVGRTAGKHTGKGTVKVPWLASRMAVEFTDISINGQLHLSSGEVKVETYPSAPNANQIGSVYVGSITSFITANNAQGGMGYSTNMAAVNGALSAVNYFTHPKKMPLGVKSVKGDSISFINMTFYPNKSEYDLVALKQTNAQLQSQNIGFKALNVKFKLRKPVSVPERIELVEDVIVGNTNNKVAFTFMAPVSSNIGCYIDFNENGFQQYGLEVEADFTRNWMIPSPDNGGKSTASLSAVGTSWNDLILTGILEKSEIMGTNEITILASNIAFDMSDSLNPANITFPSNYKGETTNLWNGFHMEQLVVELPNYFTTPAGGYIPVTIDDMIIDNQGLTFHLEATNVIQFGSASISDLAVSIDTVHVEMEASSLVDAYVTGDIAIPVQNLNNYNPLHYNALFHHQQGTLDSNYIQLTINPVGSISSGLFRDSLGDVSIILEPTSSMSVYAGKVDSTGNKARGFVLGLDGKFLWVDAPIGPVKFDSLLLDFQGLKMAYHKNASQNFNFKTGAWSLSNPQELISGFPVSITNIHYEPKQATGTQLANGQLNMDVIFNLSSDIGGATSIGIKTSIEDNSSSGGGKFEPKCDGAVVDSINIYANLAAVTINGAIGIRSNDPVFGDGFKGTLSAEFKAGITASALAEFGNTSYLNSNLYRYWRVEAEATFPAPGIVFLPAIAFRGFGGGAYKNMDVSLNSSGTSYNFTPLKSNFGFIAKAVIATSPEEKTFNADCSLLAQFSQSNGITNIGFTGDFYVGASLSTASRAKAQIIGDLGVTYDFPLKHFNLSANVDVNAPPITTPNPANLVLDINGKTNLWYYKFGEPTNLNTVNVMGVSLYEYLICGNDITGPTGFTQKFRDAYYDAVNYYPSVSSLGSGGVDSNTATGKGFALGIGFEFDKQGDIVLNKYKSKNKKCALYYDLGAGAELHLSFMEYAGSCSSTTSPYTNYSPVGINGYRAKGDLGFYGTASASVRKYKDNNAHDIKWNKPIADIGAGAWITGEFPNPYYAAGAIDGNISAFNDFIQCSFHLEFETGTSCSNSGVVSTTVVTQGDAAADQQSLLVQYVKPTQSFNFPTTSPLAVKYGLVPDEVFDVAEQQDNGSIINRMFKLVVERDLEMQDPITNIWSSVPIRSDENNLGEFLYTISIPLTQATGSLSIVGNPSSTASTPASGSVSNMVVASGGSANTGLGQATNSISLVYPTPPAPPGYANLPPEPDPIINTLLDDINYRFTVTATLKEYKSLRWLNALKRDNTPVTQTVIKTFRTGDMQLPSSNTTL